MASQSFNDAFGQISAALGGGDGVLRLRIELIDEDPGNPRTRFDDDELAALAETIRRKNLLQPLTVRPQGPDGRYRLRFGARRLRAAKLAGLKEVRALVQADDVEPSEAIVEQIIENDQREGLSTADLARAVGRLLELGLKQAEIGGRLGRPKEQIAMLASVRDMPPELQALTADLGLRTLYELHTAWKTDQGRTRVWLAGRAPSAITQSAARELAGRPVLSRQLVRDPSDGSVRVGSLGPSAAEAAPKPQATAPTPKDEKLPKGTAVFEVSAPGVRGTLVLDNVRAVSIGVDVRRANGEIVTVPAAKVKILRTRPG